MYNKTKKAVLGLVAAVTALLLPSVPLSVCAATSSVTAITSTQAKEALPLPYTGTVSMTDGESADTYVSCKKLSIVTVSAKTNGGGRAELSVCTDSGELISRAYPAEDGSAMLQFVPAYTGAYRIGTACRSNTGETSEVSLAVSEYSKHKVNEIESLPVNEEHSKKTHRYLHASALYSSHTKEAEGWELSVFSFSHGAADVLSYKLSARGSSKIRAVLYTYEGDCFRAHESHSADSFDAGDAQPLTYSAQAYLLVYSSGEFTLDADLLKCNDAVTETITLPYSGTLDTSDGAKCYDEDAYAELIEEFPFCGVKNEYVKYFSADAGVPAVISLICQRREHSSFFVVSDENGLSARSRFPLRSYNSYCSEVHPTEQCCEQFITDSGKAVIAYTGSSLSATVKIDAAALFSSDTEYENEYHKNTPLPTPSVSSICSDSDKFAVLGLEPHDSESAELVGCVIYCEDGTRVYYGAEDTLDPPEKKGECRMFAIIKRTYVRDEWGESSTHLVPICSFKTTGVIFIPTIEELIEGIENKEPGSFLYLVLLSLPVIVAASATVLLVIRKKRKANGACEQDEKTQSEEDSDDDKVV